MLEEILRGNPIVIVKLGAGADDYRFIPRHIRKHIVLVCLDAATDCKSIEGFARVICVNQVIAESEAPREFIERAWWGGSSVLEARPELVAKYGLERFYAVRSRTAVTPTTLPAVLTAHGLVCDALITDLEGLDVAVLQSCGALLDGITLIQSELRFEPFYVGEPAFHEAVAWLDSRGLGLIGLKAEEWKPISSVRDRCPDGVAVWADCTFFREDFANEATLAKSVILLCLFGQKSLAAHLLERYACEELRDELLPLTVRLPWWQRMGLRLRTLARALKAQLMGKAFPHVA